MLAARSCVRAARMPTIGPHDPPWRGIFFFPSGLEAVLCASPTVAGVARKDLYTSRYLLLRSQFSMPPSRGGVRRHIQGGTPMPMRPDPTFHASPKLAMEAPPENFAYTLLL